jgi:predicted secreted hydrolase
LADGKVTLTPFLISDLLLALEPLMDDQEQDARASTGTVYWEGAVTARSGDRIVGRGYLELTGYWRAFRL